MFKIFPAKLKKIVVFVFLSHRLLHAQFCFRDFVFTSHLLCWFSKTMVKMMNSHTHVASVESPFSKKIGIDLIFLSTKTLKVFILK